MVYFWGHAKLYKGGLEGAGGGERYTYRGPEDINPTVCVYIKVFILFHGRFKLTFLTPFKNTIQRNGVPTTDTLRLQPYQAKRTVNRKLEATIKDTVAHFKLILILYSNYF